MRKHVYLAVITAVTLPLLSSCTVPGESVTRSNVATAPAIRIASPENYALFQTAVNNRNITIEVTVRNFNLVEKTGQPDVAGEGHIVYLLDVNPSENPATASPGAYIRSTATSYTWTNLSDGPHMLVAELVNNDDTSLSPPVYDYVQTYLQFDVLAPNVRIISPENGSSVPVGDVTVQVEIHNFVVVDRLGEPNLSGQGHLHYFMDIDPPVESGKPAITAEGTWAESLGDSFTWHNVNPGKHIFAVELVTNDHRPLYPPSLRPAYDEVTVEVVPPAQ